MSNQKVNVTDTIILSISPFDLGCRRYARVEIAYDKFTFEPGQFIMIRTEDKDIRWAYPYMIQSTTQNSISVVALALSDLYEQASGDSIAVWGPRGMCPVNDKPFVLIGEAAMFPMLMPFVKNFSSQCTGIVLVGDATDSLITTMSEKLSLCCCQDIPVAIEALGDAECIVAAFNPKNILKYSEIADKAVRNATMMFVPTKMACGIGACAGCVIHSSEIPTGIKVCCEGPFLPLNKLDLEADINCFFTLS